MFQLTTEVEQALARARDEAVRMRHVRVRTEHLLLGLLGDAAFVELLSRQGLTKLDVRSAVRVKTELGAALAPDALPLSDEAQETLDAAAEEVAGFGHSVLSVAHLLLGLLKEPDGLGGRILESFGASVDGVRHEVLEFFAEQDEELEVPLLLEY